jgi:hypothetical protein
MLTTTPLWSVCSNFNDVYQPSFSIVHYNWNHTLKLQITNLEFCISSEYPLWTSPDNKVTTLILQVFSSYLNTNHYGYSNFNFSESHQQIKKLEPYNKIFNFGNTKESDASMVALPTLAIGFSPNTDLQYAIVHCHDPKSIYPHEDFDC